MPCMNQVKLNLLASSAGVHLEQQAISDILAIGLDLPPQLGDYY